LTVASFWFGSNVFWGAMLGSALSMHVSLMAPRQAATTLGVLYFLATLPALVVPLAVGPISDRCASPHGRRKPFVLWGALAACVGMAAMAWAVSERSLPLYIGAYLVVQVGANVALAAFTGVLPDVVPRDQRGVASGYMAVMCQVGTLVGVLMAGPLLDSGRHTLLFGLLMLAVGGMAAFVWYRLPERPLVGRFPPLDWRGYLRSLWISPREYPNFAWVWVSRALMMTGFYALQPYLLFFLRDVIRVERPATTVGLLLGLILLATIPAAMFSGALSERTGRKPLVIGASMVIAAACLGLLACRSIPQTLGVGLVFGLAYGAYISSSWALGTDVLPSREDAAKDMAVWHVSMTVPQMFAPALAGQLLNLFPAGTREFGGEITTVYGWMGYALVLAGASAAFLFGGILVKNVRGIR